MISVCIYVNFMANRIIGISGESGVGKSTLARALTKKLNPSNGLCMDDYHKFDRYSSKWDKYSHYNPRANKMFLYYFHILLTIINVEFHLREYNHISGKFNKSRKIIPQKNNIIDGLLCYYGLIVNFISLKVYLENSLEVHNDWRFKRAKEIRQISDEIIHNRIKIRDREKKFIQKQLKNADIIVKINETENSSKTENLFVEISYFRKEHFIIDNSFDLEINHIIFSKQSGVVNFVINNEKEILWEVVSEFISRNFKV